MKKLLLTSIVGVPLLIAGVAKAESCKFQYWQVIPKTIDCKTYFLPDFEFRGVSNDQGVPTHVQRFCNQFEISSEYGIQKTGYCYTGEGDRTGPSFRLGNENADATSMPDKDRVYFADLNFQGCINDQRAEGVVFGVGGWRKAPKTIKRFWPLKNPRDVTCAR